MQKKVKDHPVNLEQFKLQSKHKEPENKKFLAQVRKKEPRQVDTVFHNLHHEVFEKVDCLQCANCCKTTSPIFYQNDIEKVAKGLRMKPGDFVEKYLRVDEDKDYVLKSTPCPFLDAENYCSVYAVRPKACREYPHTDRKKMVQITELILKNTLVCPAVFEMVERLKHIPLK
ncbi:MAG: YkgJ family cysteine cluster protein [Cyclobacteriaceae bacterium]